MLIYICCAGGATSSMFCQRIAEASNCHTYVDYVLEIINDIDRYIEEYDMVFVYGPASLLTPVNIKELKLDQRISAILIAPQVRFITPKTKTLFEQYNIPVEDIDFLTFGRMDGEKGYQDIMNMIQKSTIQ